MSKLKIISVVPSFTELLFDLGLDNYIVGVTRFCIHPKAAKSKTKIGGTKSLNIKKILGLNPTIIIANKEENSRTDIEELQKHCDVWVTDIYNLNDALEVITKLGHKTNVPKAAAELITNIQFQFGQLRALRPTIPRKVAYLIWENPIMLAGKNTFINELLRELNWENIITDVTSRYPEITIEKLKELNPDLILLSSEPFPFKHTHLKKYQKEFVNSDTILVDGEMFSWYGSHLLQAPNYFINLIEKVGLN